MIIISLVLTKILFIWSTQLNPENGLLHCRQISYHRAIFLNLETENNLKELNVEERMRQGVITT